MNEQTNKPMTKQGLAIEVIRIVHDTRSKVTMNSGDELQALIANALNEIESICHFEASEEITEDERIRRIMKEEIGKMTCIGCHNVTSNLIDGRCNRCYITHIPFTRVGM